MAVNRCDRVSEAYMNELLQILRNEVRDPRLEGAFVTNVVFTPDLRLAKVYFNLSGGRVREKEALKGFDRCKGFLRKTLSDRVRLKFAPDLKFYYDESFEVQEKIDELFEKIEQDNEHEES